MYNYEVSLLIIFFETLTSPLLPKMLLIDQERQENGSKPSKKMKKPKIILNSSPILETVMTSLIFV